MKLMLYRNHQRFIICFFASMIVSVACAPGFAQSEARAIRAEPLYEQCASLSQSNEAVANEIVAIRDKDPQRRVKAAETLAKSCDARAVEPLIAALKDPEVTVRIAAVQALGQLGDRSAIDPLIEALSDEDWRARTALARALCSFQAHASSNAALNVLVNPADRKVTDEGDMRARCLGVLMINQLRDVRFSRKAIGFLFMFLGHEDERLRAIAEETALELKNTRNGYHELIGILKQHTFPDFRRKAAHYLGKFNIEEARQALAEAATGDRDPIVRKIAKEAVESQN